MEVVDLAAAGGRGGGICSGVGSDVPVATMEEFDLSFSMRLA